MPSPVPSLTRTAFERNIAALIESNQEALTAHTAIAEMYHNAVLGLTTVPSFWTRLKMALSPERHWPHIKEPELTKALAVLHGRLAAAISRALVLEHVGGSEDSQTEAGNAEERARGEKMSKPFLVVDVPSGPDLGYMDAADAAVAIFGSKAEVHYEVVREEKGKVLEAKFWIDAPIGESLAQVGQGATWYDAFRSAGYPKIAVDGILAKIARERGKGER